MNDNELFEQARRAYNKIKRRYVTNINYKTTIIRTRT